jgi:hypothetical protein
MSLENINEFYTEWLNSCSNINYKIEPTADNITNYIRKLVIFTDRNAHFQSVLENLKKHVDNTQDDIMNVLLMYTYFVLVNCPNFTQQETRINIFKLLVSKLTSTNGLVDSLTTLQDNINFPEKCKLDTVNQWMKLFKDNIVDINQELAIVLEQNIDVEMAVKQDIDIVIECEEDDIIDDQMKLYMANKLLSSTIETVQILGLSRDDIFKWMVNPVNDNTITSKLLSISMKVFKELGLSNDEVLVKLTHILFSNVDNNNYISY